MHDFVLLKDDFFFIFKTAFYVYVPFIEACLKIETYIHSIQLENGKNHRKWMTKNNTL